MVDVPCTAGWTSEFRSTYYQILNLLKRQRRDGPRSTSSARASTTSSTPSASPPGASSWRKKAVRQALVRAARGARRSRRGSEASACATRRSRRCCGRTALPLLKPGRVIPRARGRRGLGLRRRSGWRVRASRRSAGHCAPADRTAGAFIVDTVLHFARARAGSRRRGSCARARRDARTGALEPRRASARHAGESAPRVRAHVGVLELPRNLDDRARARPRRRRRARAVPALRPRRARDAADRSGTGHGYSRHFVRGDVGATRRRD